MTRSSNLIAASLGLILAGGSLLALPTVLAGFGRSSLEVHLDAPDLSPDSKLHFSAHAPGAFLTLDGVEFTEKATVLPGLHQLQWKRRYGGGHSQTAGHTQLVGPFQKPEAPPCSIWLLVDQSFLDDGAAGEGTLAHLLGAQVQRQLRDYKVWPLGKFIAVDSVAASWIPWDQTKSSLLKKVYPENAPAGHLHLDLTISFESGKVPLIVMVQPRLVEGALKLEIHVSAALDLDSRIYQWVADLFDGSAQAGAVIKRDLRAALRGVLQKPPPLALDSHTSLDFEFCRNERIIFSKKGFVAVPLALPVAEGISAPLRPTLGKPLDQAMQAPLGLDIDQNGLNALLQQLWSSKVLDRYLGDELVDAFNEQETVRNFLSLRLAQANFHLPPTLSFKGNDRFELRAAARLELQDGLLKTPARMFTEISFSLGDAKVHADVLPRNLRFGAIELTCQPKAGILKPCYSDILTQVQHNQEELAEALSNAFTHELRKLVIGRHLGDTHTPGHYVVQDLRFQSKGSTLRASLEGTIVSQSLP